MIEIVLYMKFFLFFVVYTKRTTPFNEGSLKYRQRKLEKILENEYSYFTFTRIKEDCSSMGPINSNETHSTHEWKLTLRKSF